MTHQDIKKRQEIQKKNSNERTNEKKRNETAGGGVSFENRQGGERVQVAVHAAIRLMGRNTHIHVFKELLA